MIPDEVTLKKIWLEVPPDYYFKLNRLQKLWHEWKWLIFSHLLTGASRQPRTILEVGCSAGHLSAQLASLFPHAHVTGVDVYKKAITEARKRYPALTFVVADAHRLPFDSNSFDLIVCSETIEHVVDPETVLHEIARVMKSDGRALVEMDSHSVLFRFIWFLWIRLGRGKVWRDAHLHPFSASELETLLTSNGFAVREKMFSHLGMAVSFLVDKKNISQHTSFRSLAKRDT